MDSKYCITISDEEDDVTLADVSVQVIDHVKKKRSILNLDASVIDLTNADDSFRPIDKGHLSPSPSSSPVIPPPTPSPPSRLPSEDCTSNRSSPPVIPPPTPSPPPTSRSSFEESPLKTSSSSSSLTTRNKPPKRPSPTNSKSPKSNKQAREEAKRLKIKEKEEEKLQKEANRANAANKALQNCTAILDKNILKIINDQEEISFRTLFDESMLTYRFSDYSKFENSVTWTCKRVEIENGQCVAKFKDADWIIVVMEASEYLRRIIVYRDNPDDSQSIKNYICDIRRRSKLDVILIVYNLANFLKGERLKDAKNYRKTFKDRFEGTTHQSSNEKPDQNGTATTTANIGTTDLQDLRLMLEVEIKHQHPDWKMHIDFYEKTQDIVQTIARYTSSIAKFEIKRKTRSATNLDWAINMDKEKAVDPTKSSEDLTKLWITQLQQFPQITLPIAKAVAAEYPSPGALLDQYRHLSTSEAEDLLAELYVQRNLKRQIGPNISRKIHCFMTCGNPDVHIGYG